MELVLKAAVSNVVPWTAGLDVVKEAISNGAAVSILGSAFW